MKRLHWFQYVSYGILALFMGILIYVVSVAHLRRPGTTGIDAPAIQKLRYDSMQK